MKMKLRYKTAVALSGCVILLLCVTAYALTNNLLAPRTPFL
jgi:hypothetical protein